MVRAKYFSRVVPKIFFMPVDEDISRCFTVRRATIASSISAVS